MRLKPTLLALALAAALPAAGAMDLLDVWRAAAAHDPEFAAARAAYDAGEARRAEGDALWRPTVALQAGAAYATQENSIRGAQFSAPGFGRSAGVDFNTSVTGGISTRYGLSLRQPLYNRELDARKQQLKLAAGAAGEEWRAAQQQLMLRAAQGYFDVVLAAQQVRLLKEQERAVEQARVEAEDRFRIGDRPVTDVHEATARADALRAQRLAAESELEMRRTQLADLIGQPVQGELAAPAASGTAPREPLDPLDAWLARAASDNPQVLMARAQAASAEQEIRKTSTALAPTVDLVAQVGRDYLSGSGAYGNASNAANQAALGVQLNIPLYTGGMRGARNTENEALARKALADLDRARLQAQQQARAAWLDLSVARSRITALESGWRASLARLDATRVGLQAGDRTTLDLLNAQNDAAAAELALLQARVQQAMQRLRLAAVAGALDESRLAAVNHELAAPPATR
ncbi:MAG: TolC family outer membrane protein [Burkholderiales bacterium]|nr:TolC family outer membrane protein [Burkholderiales bacterium]